MKKLLPWLGLSAAVLLGLPCLTVTFVKGDSGMALCFLLFFGFNPLYAVVAGIFAGRDAKALRPLPWMVPLCFLAGTWLLFDMGELAFFLYAAVYLLLGLAAWLITLLVKKHLCKSSVSGGGEGA